MNAPIHEDENRDRVERMLVLAEQIDSILSEHAARGNAQDEASEALCLVIGWMVNRAYQGGHGELADIKASACRGVSSKIDMVATLQREIAELRTLPRPTTNKVGHA